MANHGLRTSGVHNGNWGAPKVQAKKETLDLTEEILNRDNLRIPDRDAAFTKLQQAYNQTTDPRMRQVLGEMLRARKATLQPTQVKPNGRPVSEFGDMCRLIR